MIKREGMLLISAQKNFFPKTIYLHVLEVLEHEFSDFRGGVNVKPSYPVRRTLYPVRNSWWHDNLSKS